MSTFRIIALKVLGDSPKYLSKVLMPYTTYFFFQGYEDVPGTHFVRRVSKADEGLRLYDVQGLDGRRISVEVSAIVGRNGEGCCFGAADSSRSRVEGGTPEEGYLAEAVQ